MSSIGFIQCSSQCCKNVNTDCTIRIIITSYTDSSSKHLTTNATTTTPPPPTAAAAAANDPSSYNPAPLAIPTQLLTATNCKYKLLWLVDDIHVVQRVLSDLKQPSLSPACHTDRIAYWVSNYGYCYYECCCFVRATILLYLIGRPVRATITLYPIGRPVRATYYYTVSYRETC